MSDGKYEGPERRDPGVWWKHWATPAGVILILAAVTWGVQLNVGYAQLTALTAAAAERSARVERLMQEAQVGITRAATVLEQLAIQVRENRADIKAQGKPCANM